MELALKAKLSQTRQLLLSEKIREKAMKRKHQDQPYKYREATLKENWPRVRLNLGKSLTL